MTEAEMKAKLDEFMQNLFAALVPLHQQFTQKMQSGLYNEAVSDLQQMSNLVNKLITLRDLKAMIP